MDSDTDISDIDLQRILQELLKGTDQFDGSTGLEHNQCQLSIGSTTVTQTDTSTSGRASGVVEVCSQESALNKHSTLVGASPPSIVFDEFLDDCKVEEDNAPTDSFICGDATTTLKANSPFGVVPPSPGGFSDHSMPLLDVDLIDKTLQSKTQTSSLNTSGLDSSLMNDGFGWEDNYTDLFQFIQ